MLFRSCCWVEGWGRGHRPPPWTARNPGGLSPGPRPGKHSGLCGGPAGGGPWGHLPPSEPGSPVRWQRAEGRVDRPWAEGAAAGKGRAPQRAARCQDSTEPSRTWSRLCAPGGGRARPPAGPSGPPPALLGTRSSAAALPSGPPGARAVHGAALPGPSRPRAPAPRGRASVSSAVPAALPAARRGAHCLPRAGGPAALVVAGVVVRAARLLGAGRRGRRGRGRATAPAVLVHSGPRPSSGSQDDTLRTRGRRRLEHARRGPPGGQLRTKRPERVASGRRTQVVGKEGGAGAGGGAVSAPTWCGSSAEATRGDQDHCVSTDVPWIPSR